MIRGRLELPTRSLGNCCSIPLSYQTVSTCTFPGWVDSNLFYMKILPPVCSHQGLNLGPAGYESAALTY